MLAERSALGMQTIEELTDAEIAEAHRSAETFAGVEEATAPLDAVLSLVHAIDWLEVKDRAGKTALQSFFGGLLGDPIEIALGRAEVAAAGPAEAVAEQEAGIAVARDRASRTSIVAASPTIFQTRSPRCWQWTKKPLRPEGSTRTPKPMSLVSRRA